MHKRNVATSVIGKELPLTNKIVTELPFGSAIVCTKCILFMVHRHINTNNYNISLLLSKVHFKCALLLYTVQNMSFPLYV